MPDATLHSRPAAAAPDKGKVPKWPPIAAKQQCTRARKEKEHPTYPPGSVTGALHGPRRTTRGDMRVAHFHICNADGPLMQRGWSRRYTATPIRIKNLSPNPSRIRDQFGLLFCLKHGPIMTAATTRTWRRKSNPSTEAPTPPFRRTGISRGPRRPTGPRGSRVSKGSNGHPGARRPLAHAPRQGWSARGRSAARVVCHNDVTLQAGRPASQPAIDVLREAGGPRRGGRGVTKRVTARGTGAASTAPSSIEPPHGPHGPPAAWPARPSIQPADQPRPGPDPRGSPRPGRNAGKRIGAARSASAAAAAGVAWPACRESREGRKDERGGVTGGERAGPGRAGTERGYRAGCLRRAAATPRWMQQRPAKQRGMPPPFESLFL